VAAVVLSVRAQAETIDAPEVTRYSIEGKVRLEVELTRTSTHLRPLKNLLFAKDRAAPLPDSLGGLDAVAAVLTREPWLRLRVEAHTDAQATPAHNLALSARRAAWVCAYLVAKGIDVERVSFAGLGSTRPLASNDTEAGRAQNRRVEFVLVSRERLTLLAP
jgi:outer membrane protein OmpA-like peptidoglycan-associated protein